MLGELLAHSLFTAYQCLVVMDSRLFHMTDYSNPSCNAIAGLLLGVFTMGQRGVQWFRRISSAWTADFDSRLAVSRIYRPPWQMALTTAHVRWMPCGRVFSSRRFSLCSSAAMVAGQSVGGGLHTAA